MSQEALKKKSMHSPAGRQSMGGSRERGGRVSPKDIRRDVSPRTAAALEIQKKQERHEQEGGVGVVGLYDGIAEDAGRPRKRKPAPKKGGGLIAGKKQQYDAALRRRSHKGLIETMKHEEESEATEQKLVRRPSFAPLRRSKSTMGDVIVDKLMVDSGMTRPGTYQEELFKELTKSAEELKGIEEEVKRVSQLSKDLDLELQLRGAGDPITTDSWWSMKEELPPGYTRYLFTEEDKGLTGFTQPPPELPAQVPALPSRESIGHGQDNRPLGLASRLHFEQQQRDVSAARTQLAELAASLGLV